MSSEQRPLAGRRYLVTGIADDASLATTIAAELAAAGATLVCSGLGLTKHHAGLSERAARHLEATFDSFRETLRKSVSDEAQAIACDLSIDASLDELAEEIAADGPLDGVVHAVARDRTLGGDGVRSLLSVTREEFLDCMDVSAYSLIALVQRLLGAGALEAGASVVSLSYLGAERVVPHPYKNVAVAKSALERISVELAHELGSSHGIRVNAVRFSPYAASRAGGAIPGLAEAAAACEEKTALGNAKPRDLAREVVHLLSPGHAITGEIRNVDGGYRILAG